MTAHTASHQKGRFGKHGYTLADYGIVPGELLERFKPYIERYGIPLEGAAR